MDDEALLSVLYRRRPATIAAVAELAQLSDEAARTSVLRLRHRGLLMGDGENVQYVHPAVWTSSAVARQTAELREQTGASLRAAEDLVEGLPALLRHWAVGETASDLGPIFTREGQFAEEDIWFDIASHDQDAMDIMLPNVDRFLTSDPERVRRFTSTLHGKARVRIIIPSEAVAHPSAKERIAHYMTAGVQYRTLEKPVSWFWIDGDHVAVPYQWGEARPTGVLAIRNPSLADLARDYFEQFWRRAAPLESVGAPWAPLLVLMRQGATLDMASRAVGINPRTGGRRVAAAMEHYGTTTLFGLGVAFGEDLAATATASTALTE